MSLLRPALALAVISSAALVPSEAIGRPVIRRDEVARVVINDNRRPAGHLHDGVLTLRLDARLGEWHPDGDDAPGAVVPAFAEEGGAPSIPGPLVRVPAGTVVALSIRNSLQHPLTLRGLHDRVSKAVPGIRDSTIVVAPGDSTTLRIRLDAAGSYYYYGSTNGRNVDWRSGPDAQLGGAIVVDPPGAGPKIDRVFVLGLWADTAGKVLMRRTRILAVINGRSWPHTERLDYAVGDTVRFHVLNASGDSHPMHLHGFYFMVDGRGDGSSDTTYAPDRRRRVNTEDLLPGMTMTMTWVPERPGNWLFHCHLPDHFSARGSLGMPRLARADAMSEDHHAAMNHATTGMNGLVVGITVHGRAARSAPAATRASRALRLLVRPSTGGSAEQPFYSFALDKNGVVPAPDSGLHVGPPIVLTRDEPVRITVVNTLDVPTSVHWHGIELESYFDGVAGFSGAGQHLSPIIAPHDSFVVRFTPPRAGTFMYHTHVDETRQQLAGLAGPLIVLEPGRAFAPSTDHAVLITTPPAWADELRSVLLNGSAAPPPMELRPGVAQRFRFINITTRRPNIHVELWRDSTLLSWRPLAKDGADLPATRQVAGPARSLITIGDTRDFEFVPEPGADLTLLVRAATGAVLVRQSLRVTNPRSSFQQLLDDHWQWVLRESPILATTLGDHRYDRELGDLTVAAMDRRAREAAAFLARANALDTTSLSAGERVSLAILRRGLSEEVEGNRFGQRTVLFTTYYGWHTGFADIGTTHPFRDRADYEAYVARLAAYPRYNRGAIETTRTALAGGFAQPCAPFTGYERTIAGVMDSTPEKSRFLEPFVRRPSNIAESDWASLRARAVTAVRDSVYPAYRALLDFYRTDYAPHCRSAAGISTTPNGTAYYAFRVRRETTTELMPEEVYQLGLREVARIGAEMDSVAKAAGYADRKAYVAHLRTDPSYYPRTADELLATASVLTKRIDGEMPKYFGHLPRLPYTVKPIPDAVAPGVTAAYYGRGSLEGGRPGIYWVNTSKLDQRPYYELTSLTLHESVPGHHQQIAIAQELDLPIFRRYGTSFAAFTEGWGLYAERLGIEMGLYDTPEKQMGRLSYEMWRACRLVVDPAIHMKGWTREQAIEYMLAQTALSRGNVEAEVNRYITWPGQATAYKVGELRIRQLRAQAEQQLGARFDLRGFNDAVLENGPVPLDVMEAQVKRWIATRK